jgi:hypothetical protein
MKKRDLKILKIEIWVNSLIVNYSRWSYPRKKVRVRMFDALFSNFVEEKT